jgi:hypothetical protein
VPSLRGPAVKVFQTLYFRYPMFFYRIALTRADGSHDTLIASQLPIQDWHDHIGGAYDCQYHLGTLNSELFNLLNFLLKNFPKIHKKILDILKRF